MFGGKLSARAPFAGGARSLCALLACAGALAGTTPAIANGNSTTMQGLTQVEVINPLTIVKVKDMDFASVAAAPSAGTVVLNPATSVCSKTGVVILTGNCQAAVFDGLGSHLEVVRVQIPTNITLNGSKGGTMLLDTFTLDFAPDLQFLGGNGNGVGNGNRRYSIQPNSGLFTFRLGGTLHVAANQTPGAYSGTFSVTVRYQ